MGSFLLLFSLPSHNRITLAQALPLHSHSPFPTLPAEKNLGNGSLLFLLIIRYTHIQHTILVFWKHYLPLDPG